MSDLAQVVAKVDALHQEIPECKKRSSTEDSLSSPDVVKSLGILENLPPKKRRVDCGGSVSSSSQDTCDGKRKPAIAKPTPKSGTKQMRYEPDVPMTKEEASAWRREQRRLRNRESAAASRQKTRDRINELEIEVEGWKDKCERLEAMLRAATGASPDLSPKQESPKPTESRDLNFPAEIVTSSPPTISIPDVITSEASGVVSPQATPPSSPLRTELKESNEARQQQHLTETISRPAVKIAGTAVAIPSLDISKNHSVVSDASDSSVTDETVSSGANPIPAPSGSLLDGEFLDDLLFDALSSL